MIYVLWRCGLRVGELVALTPGDVSPGELRLRLTKSAKSRLVPMDDVTAAHVAAWASRRAAMGYSDDQRLFCRLKDGGTLSTTGVREWLNRLKASAGLADRRITPHGFRHRAAATVGGSCSLLDTSRYLGHSSPAVTLRYLSSLGGDPATIRAVKWE